MPMERYNPLRELLAMQEKMNRLLEGVVEHHPLSQEIGVDLWEPAADIRETGEEIRVDVDLPGVDQQDMEISLHQGVLEIRGERRAPPPPDGETCTRRERRYGRFARTFLLTAPIQAERITATVDRGVLTIRLPVAVEKSHGKIRIRVDGA